MIDKTATKDAYASKKGRKQVCPGYAVRGFKVPSAKSNQPTNINIYMCKWRPPATKKEKKKNRNHQILKVPPIWQNTKIPYFSYEGLGNEINRD